MQRRFIWYYCGGPYPREFLYTDDYAGDRKKPFKVIYEPIEDEL